VADYVLSRGRGSSGRIILELHEEAHVRELAALAPQAVSEPPARVAAWDANCPRPGYCINPTKCERKKQCIEAPHQAAEPAPADKLRAEMQTLGYSDTAINAMGDSTTMMQRAIDARKMLMAAAPPTPTPALPDEVARTDTERLDWIERKVCDVSRLGDSARTVRIAWNNGADHVDIGPHCHANWRVAIDAAIAAQEAKS
jgi:hypothetical protein